MSVQRTVDDQGRYDGKTLRELWPLVVDEVAREVDPIEVILFGSVATGDDGPDSDIDLLVVFEHIEPAEKRPMMARIRSGLEQNARSERIEYIAINTAAFNRVSGGTLRRPPVAYIASNVSSRSARTVSTRHGSGGSDDWPGSGPRSTPR